MYILCQRIREEIPTPLMPFSSPLTWIWLIVNECVYHKIPLRFFLSFWSFLSFPPWPPPSEFVCPGLDFLFLAKEKGEWLIKREKWSTWLYIPYSSFPGCVLTRPKSTCNQIAFVQHSLTLLLQHPQNERILLLLDEHEIAQTSFLPPVYRFIKDCHISAEFTSEEKSKIVNSVRSEVCRSGKEFSPKTAWEFFIGYGDSLPLFVI